MVALLLLVLFSCIPLSIGLVGDAQHPAAGCNDIMQQLMVSVDSSDSDSGSGSSGSGSGSGSGSDSSGGVPQTPHMYYINYQYNTVIPVLCDFTIFPNRGATLVYKLSSGVSGHPYSMWSKTKPLNDVGGDNLSLTLSTSNYVSRLLSLWSLVNQSSVCIYTGGELQQYIDFDTENQSFTGWFSNTTVRSSSWPDVAETKQYFSIMGDNAVGRNWYINVLWNICPSDVGYLLVSGETDPCDSSYNTTGTPRVAILYSTLPNATTTGSYGKADVFAVWADVPDIDINECLLNSTVCGDGYICNNTLDSYTCEDINECVESPPPPCDPLTTCNNTNGSFTCTPCPAGYTGTGITLCIDIDECKLGKCDNLTSCYNTNGSFECSSCPTGYAGNGTTGCKIVVPCGDGICDTVTENCVTCLLDCLQPCGMCGDNYCSSVEGEDCLVCLHDCPSPCGLCGDGACNGTLKEECSTCTEDCGACVPLQCPADCSHHGNCTAGFCSCFGNFNGPACAQENLPVVVAVNQTHPSIVMTPLGTGGSAPSSNSTNSTNTASSVSFQVSIRGVIEYNIHNEIVSTYSLNDSSSIVLTEIIQLDSFVAQYTFTLPNKAQVIISISVFNSTSTINFAGQSFTASPNTIKFTLAVKNWGFSSVRNTFAVLMDSSAQGGSGTFESDCGPPPIQTDENGNLRWFKLITNTLSLYGQFFPKALVDNIPQLLKISFIKNPNSNGGTVVVASTSFFDALVIDPNFAVLVETVDAQPICNKDIVPDKIPIPTSTIISITVSIVGAILLVAAVFTIYKSQQRMKFRKQGQSLLALTRRFTSH